MEITTCKNCLEKCYDNHFHQDLRIHKENESCPYE